MLIAEDFGISKQLVHRHSKKIFDTYCGLKETGEEATMLQPTIFRYWSGYSIRGQEYELNLIPDVTGIAVQVIALPEVTQGDYRVNVLEKESDSFKCDEIMLTDTRLECRKSFNGYTFCHTGFVVLLEPGMHHHVQEILPKLFAIVDLAKRMEPALRLLLEQVPHHHLMGIPLDVLGKIVLDHTEVAAAVELSQKYYALPWHPEWLFALEHEEVKAILEEAKSIR